MSFTLTRPAAVAGLALLAALAAGCGPAAAAHPAAPKPAATAHHHHSRPKHAAVTTPPAASATTPAQTANPIPQGNGGARTPTTMAAPAMATATSSRRAATCPRLPTRSRFRRRAIDPVRTIRGDQ